MDQEISGKKILVVGLGVSGLWAVRWLVSKKAYVTVSDVKGEDDFEPELKREMNALGVTLECGGHRKETFFNAEMIVVSPGVPHDSEIFLMCGKKGIPILGEFELASRYINKPIIAVTGSNGKSTVTSFLGSMLQNGGFKVFVGGNIGTPLMSYLEQGLEADYVVAEVSSFQLDTASTFSPYVSMILNISPDHLDRYPNYEAYVQSKLRVFMNQGPGQYVVLNDDDKRLNNITPANKSTTLRYGLEKSKARNAYIENDKITAHIRPSETHQFLLESFRLAGEHNIENLLGVILVGLVLDVDPLSIQRTIDEFEGLPNRLERIAEVGGVAFYNDSKATNVDSAIKAVISFQRPLILIAGGRHKGADYGPLAEVSKGRVKQAILLGEAKELLATSFSGLIAHSFAEDMDQAVSEAYAYADAGDAVLLAPACSSFDMFSSYAQRGNAFRIAVGKLTGG